MSKYRKKLVVVEAMKFTVSRKDDLKAFAEGSELIYADGIKKPFLKIKTLEGDMFAEVGDYIIKGVQGEFYPCKPDIFHETYEKVDD